MIVNRNDVRDDVAAFERREAAVARDVPEDTWIAWPISWSAVWVGALASFSLVVLLGFVGIAIGAHLLDPEKRVVDLKTIGFGALVFSVAASFFAFVAGGWIAGRIAGTLRSEPAMLHGGIVWLVTLPVLMLAAALGAGSYLGAWNTGLAGTPVWAAAPTAPFVRPDLPLAGAAEADIIRYRADMAEYQKNLKQWKDDSPKVARNSALTAITALLLGLVGAVLGGWLASGEPMSITYYRTRTSRPAQHAIP
jgi:hypothetical protein